MTDEQIKHMVSRFLRWKLPDDFFPENGIRYDKRAPDMFHSGILIGANLFTEYQAQEMVEYIVEWLPEDRKIETVEGGK